MPTRKITERERLMTWARGASDEALEEAYEIMAIERRIRSGQKPAANPRTRKPRTNRADNPATPAKSGDNSAE